MLNLNHNSNKITFIVDTVASIWYESKGASIALHKLAYELAYLGHFVYINNPPLYPHKNIGVIKTEKFEIDGGWRYNYQTELFTYDQNRTVSIYPQIANGNPFNTNNVTRWILHDYEEDKWSTFGENDYICNYGVFKVPEGTKQSPLTTLDYKFNKFTNNSNPDRKGFAHLIHKNTPEWGYDFLKNIGSTLIPTYNGKKDLDYLTEEFNKYEYLLTFDDKSYYTSMAGLCGTKSIILNPNPKLTPLEYRNQNPIQTCGVAYGINDIDWANKTIGLVRDNLLQLENQDKLTISNFANYWENKLK